MHIGYWILTRCQGPNSISAVLWNYYTWLSNRGKFYTTMAGQCPVTHIMHFHYENSECNILNINPTLYIKTRGGVIANDTTLSKKQNNTDINNDRSPYGFNNGLSPYLWSDKYSKYIFPTRGWAKQSFNWHSYHIFFFYILSWYICSLECFYFIFVFKFLIKLLKIHTASMVWRKRTLGNLVNP